MAAAHRVASVLFSIMFNTTNTSMQQVSIDAVKTMILRRPIRSMVGIQTHEPIHWTVSDIAAISEAMKSERPTSEKMRVM